jgi:outer membrane protein TolC
VERQTQQLASAQLQLVLDSRSLRSQTGIEPETGAPPSIVDDLHEEAPEAAFQPLESGLPSLATAIESRRAQQQQARAQRFSLLPSLSGNVTETFTNAPGFSNHEWSWQATLTLGWNIDLTTVASVRTQDAQVDAAVAREERARLTARDEIGSSGDVWQPPRRTANTKSVN